MSELLLSSFNELNRWMDSKSYSQVLVLCDEQTAKYCYPICKDNFDFEHKLLLVETHGEAIKSFDYLQLLYKQVLDFHTTRKDLIINLGGGTISDLGGFLASTYKRGMDYLNIPTTILAMADAAIGGKTGINFSGIKNTIGSFYFPQAVFVYPSFLSILPSSELRSGYGELLKYTLIDKSIQLNDLKPNEIPDIELIKKAIKIKQTIVAADQFEGNLRKVLNVGHTIGHALESMAYEQNKPILHGEAVAWGIYFELELAEAFYHFPKKEEYQNWIQTFFNLPTFPQLNCEQLLDKMKSDKKNNNHKIAFALPKNIGEVATDFQLSSEELMYFLTPFSWPK